MKIKDVEEQLHISSHALRYYEKMGLVQPSRDENGYRNYSKEDMELLKKIRFLRDLGMPIEDIMKIISHSSEFQELLKEHIASLEIQIKSLQSIKDICDNLKNKDIPLLDTIVENNIQQDHEQKELKTLFQKVAAHMQPIETTVIGTRVDFRELVKSYIIMIPSAMFIGFMLTAAIMNVVRYVMHFTTQPTVPMNNGELPVTSSMIYVIGVIICILIGFIIVSRNVGSQYYIELFDEGVSICSRKYQSRWQMLQGVLRKDYRLRNKFYHYEDIDYVRIHLEFDTFPIYHSGVRRIYLPVYTFYFRNGETFQIKSGISIGEDSKTAYFILKNKQVTIDEEALIEDFYHQNEKSGYDFFEEHYGLNSPQKKAK